MATIHFLNVKEGDCSVIQHNSGRVSVIDVCNAKSPESLESSIEMLSAKEATRAVQGNFQQKKHPVNPIAYLRIHKVNSIFRHVQTHPDMDHMGGIKTLFAEFQPLNFWDIENQKEIPEESWSSAPHSRDEWQFYKLLRDSNPKTNPKRLTNLAGDRGQYWNCDGGDGLQILAPTQELVAAANNSGDYNDCSYVLLYRTGEHRVVFGGDSHDNTWEYILEKHGDAIRNVDLLIAPHHGRSSGRSYRFLDVLKPSLTFFGNARSEHLAYDAWNNRNLPFVTNKQANCMVVDASQEPMNLYVTNEAFARKVNAFTYYSEPLQAWFAYRIER